VVVQIFVVVVVAFLAKKLYNQFIFGKHLKKLPNSNWGHFFSTLTSHSLLSVCARLMEKSSTIPFPD
jgi:hypothetical protein